MTNEELIDDICFDCKCYPCKALKANDYCYTIRTVKEVLEKQGKKGKWKMGFDGAKCSACGRTFFITIEHGLMPAKPWFYYCPNCGADMRGE